MNLKNKQKKKWKERKKDVTGIKGKAFLCLHELQTEAVKETGD